MILDAKADVFERTDLSARLAQRLLQGFPMTYFTLAGALQSVIFAVLLTNGAMNYSHWKTPTAWILAATMGLVAILIWNEYLIGSQAYVWIQTVFDVVIHFCLAAGELLMIFAIRDDPQYWFACAAFFVLSGCGAYLNLYIQTHSRRYKSVNEVALKAVGRWPQIQLIVASLLCLLCIVCWVVAHFFNVNPTTGDGVILSSVLAGLAFLGLAFFVIRSWWYWECILKKVAEELAIDSSSYENNSTRPTIGVAGSLPFSTPSLDPSSTPVGATLIQLRLRITEEPLTARNVSAILSAFTELYAKCWLIQQDRFGDLLDYTQTSLNPLAHEDDLVITKLTYNSPAEILVAIGSFLGGTLKSSLNAFLQADLRREQKHLENEVLRLANEAQKQKLLQEAEAAKLSEREHAIELQRLAIEIKEQQIMLKERQVALGEKLLDLEKKRYNLALETAGQLIDVLRPGVNSQTKAMAARTLLPNLLHLGNGKGLDLTLLPAANSREELTTSAEQLPN